MLKDRTLSDEVAILIAENRGLRIKSDSDDTTIHLLKEQYAAVTDEIGNIRDAASRRETQLRTERDKAVIAFTEINATLLQTADLILKALRASKGDDTPEQMPPAKSTPHIVDDRLPIARLG